MDATRSELLGGRPAALGRRRILVMILLDLVTLDLYRAFWFFRSRKALNAIYGEVEVSTSSCVSLAVLLLGYDIVKTNRLVTHGVRSSAGAVELLVGLASVILGLVLSFRVKRILEWHLAGPADATSAPLAVSKLAAPLSAVLTFVFSFYYLQYVINKRILPPLDTHAVSGRAASE